ncbi:FeoA family protein [Elizabethkingia meningoseptica]|uniref:FeoA family protein n=1 Tax=Elizabethkingia meningoseptica TaxID=238 RepID=UPI002013B8FA|nr:FeoA family protein [Elizabethkingia meningoseptica]MCL1675924.1 ferrous iron transport protein A [Elizabethkingia meningoseptica]MCL1686430.1 ferrous iron transport protein A [Elizabethkingia meningoseptica]
MNETGIIVDYDNNNMEMPGKIIEMGLLPNTSFRILYQAPFSGPLYIEYGEERSKVALREEEARYIIVEALSDGK